MMKKIYVASSWRNQKQPEIVKFVKDLGFEVYDFKNPENAFHWSQIDVNWKSWDAEQMRVALSHTLAVQGYVNDFNALDGCDALILVMPCGRSAHLEAGYAIGQKKPVFILLDDGEPELMFKMASQPLCCSIKELEIKLQILK